MTQDFVWRIHFTRNIIGKKRLIWRKVRGAKLPFREIVIFDISLIFFQAQKVHCAMWKNGVSDAETS